MPRSGSKSFEAMLSYDDRLTERVVVAAAARLGRSRDSLLEDLGTFLVSHPSLERLRRLLRFGGVELRRFPSFAGRSGGARRGWPCQSSTCPRFACAEFRRIASCFTARLAFQGAGHVIVGLLRAMADDYGALVVLDHDGEEERAEKVSIHLLEQRFSAGRRFDLAAQAG